ncbi:hypothetical protein [Motilibacter aurantiacus]|uniref:hypothetical protein n=1 Tax=Motilibacter aurantiacus TaxID=2714955 RepID=UPI001409402C|nr:hypothetical protein [Motilibacter aurantiacus]NHC43944.1 hypothetical protein [Motilibacter aurantiacus]
MNLFVRVVAVLAGAGLAVLAAVAAACPVAAHQGNVGVSEITVGEAGLRYDLYLDARQLGAVVPLAGTGQEPGAVPLAGTSGQAVLPVDVERVVAEQVDVTVGGARSEPRVLALSSTDTTRLTWLGGVSVMDPVVPLLKVELEYPGDPSGGYRVDYRLFVQDEGQPHSNLAWVHDGGGTGTYVFAPGGAPLEPGLLRVQEEAGGDGVSGLAVAGAGVAGTGVAALVLLARGWRRP